LSGVTNNRNLNLYPGDHAGANLNTMTNNIELLKHNERRNNTDLELVEEFYEFLQGKIPESIISTRGYSPKMTQKKAFTIIWYLQEHFSILPDSIERCDNCGGLYDANSEGLYWETKAKHYCGGCSDLVPENYDKGRN